MVDERLLKEVIQEVTWMYNHDQGGTWDLPRIIELALNRYQYLIGRMDTENRNRGGFEKWM